MLAGLLLWRGYKIYFYDKESNRDYVGDFMVELAEQDWRTAQEILSGFFERIENGTGLSREWISGRSPRLKRFKMISGNTGIDPESWERL